MHTIIRIPIWVCLIPHLIQKTHITAINPFVILTTGNTDSLSLTTYDEYLLTLTTDRAAGSWCRTNKSSSQRLQVQSSVDRRRHRSRQDRHKREVRVERFSARRGVLDSGRHWWWRGRGAKQSPPGTGVHCQDHGLHRDTVPAEDFTGRVERRWWIYQTVVERISESQFIDEINM